MQVHSFIIDNELKDFHGKKENTNSKEISCMLFTKKINDLMAEIKLDGNQVNTRIAKCDAKLTALFCEMRCEAYCPFFLNLSYFVIMKL